MVDEMSQEEYYHHTKRQQPKVHKPIVIEGEYKREDE